MDYSVDFAPDTSPAYDGEERRGAARFVSLIRSAKLLTSQGEFICVIRDASATGVSLRTFHALPHDRALELELQNGERYGLIETRRNGREASYKFDCHVAVERLIQESWRFPKRQLRLNVSIPLMLTGIEGGGEAVTLNLSQQGARVACKETFAIEQRLRVTSDQLPISYVKVRWRKDANYGLVFENTLSLREFAMLAASVQCPLLLQDDSGGN